MEEIRETYCSQRATDTFTASAEEAIRQHGEYLQLDISARNKGRSDYERETKRQTQTDKEKKQIGRHRETERRMTERQRLGIALCSPVCLFLFSKGFSGITSRFPVGVVSMIVPFNFPINLAVRVSLSSLTLYLPFCSLSLSLSLSLGVSSLCVFSSLLLYRLIRSHLPLLPAVPSL